MSIIYKFFNKFTKPQKNKGDTMKRYFISFVKLASVAVLAFFVSACGKYYTKDFRSNKTTQSNLTGTMKPYTVNGKTYYPTVVGVGETATGVASWYGPGFHGKKTSNGEIYDQQAFTAAHKTLPMNTLVSVTNLDNGLKTTVRINDRGPFVENRIIDLSQAAATRIDMIQSGTAPVKLEVVGLDANDNSRIISTSSPIGTPASASVATPAVTATNAAGAVGVATNTASEAASSAFTALPNVEEAAELEELGDELNTNYDGSSGGGYMVQIGAYKNEQSAKELASRYQSFGGYSAYTRKSDKDGLTRIYLRGFKSEKEAKDFVRSGQFKGAFVVSE